MLSLIGERKKMDAYSQVSWIVSSVDTMRFQTLQLCNLTSCFKYLCKSKSTYQSDQLRLVSKYCSSSVRKLSITMRFIHVLISLVLVTLFHENLGFHWSSGAARFRDTSLPAASRRSSSSGDRFAAFFAFFSRRKPMSWQSLIHGREISQVCSCFRRLSVD